MEQIKEQVPRNKERTEPGNECIKYIQGQEYTSDNPFEITNPATESENERQDELTVHRQQEKREIFPGEKTDKDPCDICNGTGKGECVDGDGKCVFVTAQDDM